MHGAEIRGPVAFWGRFDLGGSPDMTLAGGEERPEGVVVHELNGAGQRDSNAERFHKQCVSPQRIPA